MAAMRTFWRAILVGLLLITAPGAGTLAREWVDSTGKFRVEGELVDVAEGHARLKLTDGREISVPIDRLSEADRKYIAESQRPKVDKKDAEKADKLIDQAFALLKLDPRNNAKLIDAKLRQAARLNPTDIRAEFLRGIYHLLVSTDPDRAVASFENCLEQQPNNAAVLSNLAVSRFKAGSYAPALEYFERSAKVAPGLAAVSQNLGRALKVHNDGRLPMPERIAEQYADLYARVAASEEFPPSQPELGWALVSLSPRSKQPAAEADLPEEITHGGTGFVVQGDYVVTNRHVVEGAASVKIRVPGRGERNGLQEAEVVAISETADVAVVRCPGISLPPVELIANVPRRGSDVMVLGFPQFWQLGATIKSTRGAVTSLPAKETDNMLLLDAEMNSGNSGGPIANKKGQVVAIATAVFKPQGGTGGRYGAGIPVASQLEFLQKHVPKFSASAKAAAEMAWPDVDQQVSRSTVLVLVTGTTPPPQDEFADMFFDPTCPACSGSREVDTPRGKQRCPHCRGLGVDRQAVIALALREERLRERETARPSEPPTNPSLPEPGNPPSVPPSVTGGIVVARAVYGAGNQTKDVTQPIRDALRNDRYLPIHPDNRKLGDPAKGQKKQLTVEYQVEGQRHRLTVAEDQVAVLPPLPPEGQSRPDADRGFKIIAARYGAGMTWVNVTRKARERILHPGEEMHWIGFVAHDPWPGVRKRVVVWFDYQGKRYVRKFMEGQFGALLETSAVTALPPSAKLDLEIEEHGWSKGKPKIALGSGAGRFHVMSMVSGSFGGNGEKLQIVPYGNKRWTFEGAAHQPVAGRVMAIRTSLRKKFEPQVREFHWSRGKQRVKMIHSSQGFCYLSRVQGNFAGGAEEVRVFIDPDDGFWYLAGRSRQPLAASAVALQLKKDADVQLRFSEFAWTPARSKIRMLGGAEGVCFLSSIGGSFLGFGERVEVRREDGHWWLGGNGKQFMWGRAYSMRVLP